MSLGTPGDIFIGPPRPRETICIAYRIRLAIWNFSLTLSWSLKDYLSGIYSFENSILKEKYKWGSETDLRRVKKNDFL